MKVKDVAIIGAGPAGIATAIQLKRYGIVPLIFEKNAIGGLLRNANKVENYPGFPDSISGFNLVKLFETQLKKSSIEVSFEEIIRLNLEDGLFLIESQNRIFHFQIVVVASGTKPRKFNDCEMPEETKFNISYEICHLLQEKEKKVVILGAGDVAFDYALSLEENNEIVILNRGEKVECLPLLWERAIASPRITYRKNTTISRILSDSQHRIFVECLSPEGMLKLNAHHLIFAIGREPQLDFLSESLKADVCGLEREGILYFVGDVRNGSFRQTAIAVGEGVMAAMKIYQRLREKHR